jgi:plasmid stabilization system protein ParE
MTLIILEQAHQEFLDEATFYDRKDPALAVRFRNEVARVVDWISQNFEVPRLRPEGYRRVNLPTFPHYVAYIVRDEVIWVVSISHSSKQPEHWIDRL